MKPPQRQLPRSRRQTVVNAIAAFSLAVLGVWLLSYVSVVWAPGQYGDFGLTIGDEDSLPANGTSYLVSTLVPDYPAARAGIKLGDRVDAALSTRARLVLTRIVGARPGEVVIIHTTQGNSRRTLTLRARSLASLSATDSFELALLTITNFIFLAVGLALVLLRPSRMTWGFYLVGFAFITATLPNNGNWSLSGIPTGWFVGVALALDIIVAAGVVGFLIFSVRFPTNAPTGWLRAIDNITPYLFVALAIVFVGTDLGLILLILPIKLTHVLLRVWFTGIVAVFVLGSVVWLTIFFQAAGPERYRVRWVVLGLMCMSIALVTNVLSWVGPLARLPQWAIAMLDLLVVVFPLTVAYAVIRHRVIDVRFVISRSLVVVMVVAIVTVIVIAVDWLFSTKLPSSRFETATYFAIALLIGLSLNSARLRISKTIDSLFFRQWRRSQEQADGIADVIRRSASRADLYEPLTSGIESAFSLASAALFERLGDGGLVRVAAVGWHAGMLWHILPDDQLARSADGSKGVANIDSLRWCWPDVPLGVARPSLIIAIAVGKNVAAVLLLGAHQDGTGLDPDEIRTIRRLCEDAAFVYSREPAIGVERPPVDQPAAVQVSEQPV